jgi:prevent-host-death family protein
MVKLSVSEARKDLSSLIDAAYAKDQRVVLVRNGKNVAALVPMADLQLLEQLEDQEDQEDIRAARKALREVKKGADTTAWEDIKKELGL